MISSTSIPTKASDPTLFPNPCAFNPDRWIGAHGQFPDDRNAEFSCGLRR